MDQFTCPKQFDLSRARKILILGPIASGKTSFSISLAKRSGLPLFFLDQLYWNPFWQASTPEEFERKQVRVIQEPEWIFEGTNPDTLDLRLQAADTVIYLHRSWWHSQYALIRRTLRWRNKQRIDMSEGCYDDFNLGFLHMMYYIWRYYRDKHPLIMKKLNVHSGRIQIVHLENALDRQAFLEAVSEAFETQVESTACQKW